MLCQALYGQARELTFTVVKRNQLTNSQRMGCLQHFFSSCLKWLLLLLSPLRILNVKYKSFYWHNVQAWLRIIREFHIIIVQHWHCVTNFCDSGLSSQGFKVWYSLNGDILSACTPIRPSSCLDLPPFHPSHSFLPIITSSTSAGCPHCLSTPCTGIAREKSQQGKRE